MVDARQESQTVIQNLMTYNSYKYLILLHLEGRTVISKRRKNDMQVNVYY